MSNKLWGGRFEKGPDQQAFDLNASISIDARMALQDVKGSIAWANATHQAGWLDDSAPSKSHPWARFDSSRIQQSNLSIQTTR